MVGKTLAVLFASAALALAQAGGMSDPGAQVPNPNSANYPNSPNYSTKAPARVGPGMVNYVEGQASLNGQPLSPRSIGSAILEPGETLSTGNGFVEILLTPGAFLRVGNNTEVQMTSAGLANTTVDLVRGAAMLEADQMIDGTNLSVSINHTSTRIEKKGLYSFDAGTQLVRVMDGKAIVSGEGRSVKLSKRDEAALTGDRAFKRQSFSDKAAQQEPLYVWSKARSQDEAMASAGSASNATEYASAGAGWYWDPYANYYGFWPADDFLYSPFGWGFYSPAYFGFWGGGYGGYGWHGRSGFHGRVNGINARVSGNHATGFHGSSGFHGGASGGFHSGGFGGGGFHGGGGGGGFHGGGGGGGHR
jgi:hypothetical protein